MTAWDGFAYFGLIIAGTLLCTAVFIAIVLAIFLIVSCWPRLHFGKPKLTSEWAFYRELSINGEPTKKPEQVYLVPWWFGWSSRRKASWFVGVVRMKAIN